MVLECQLVALLDSTHVSVRRRVRQLAAAGYVTQWSVFEHSRCCLIQSRGLAAVGSRLRAPEPRLGSYRHDVGLAWLWLAARGGAFGPVTDVIGERRLRSHDGVAPEEPYAIRLGGYDAKGFERRHYPDLLLLGHQGRRLALELELSLKGVDRREQILAGYAADRRVDAVLYFVEANSSGRSIARSLRGSTARMGLLDRIQIRSIAPIAPGDGREEHRSAPALNRTRGPLAAEAER